VLTTKNKRLLIFKSHKSALTIGVAASYVKRQGGELASMEAKKFLKEEHEWSREAPVSLGNRGGDSSWPVIEKMEPGRGCWLYRRRSGEGSRRGTEPGASGAQRRWQAVATGDGTLVRRHCKETQEAAKWASPIIQYLFSIYSNVFK
jgi:hypothetical protein